MMKEPGTREILCVGELLWDSLPSGLFLGGAPFNVAAHLRAHGLPVAMVSRVGRDRLGAEAIDRVARQGIPTDLIQRDESLPTGFVCVRLDAAGTPAYDIVAPAAWDAIEVRESVLERAGGAAAIVFGSLAQRSPRSRELVAALCERAALKVFDVNLRPPFDDPDVIRASLGRADIVKLNGDELCRLGDWLGLPAGLREATLALAERFGSPTICVTKGPSGAALLRDGRWSEHPGFEVEAVDTVGSGDAFLAGFLRAYLAGDADESALRQANLLGAYVATRSGAVPAYDDAAIANILQSER